LYKLLSSFNDLKKISKNCANIVIREGFYPSLIII
jgi:hypothetical protein